MSAGEYRVGQLSDILGVPKKGDFDPELASIFSTKNSKKKVVKRIQRNEPALPVPPPKQVKVKKEKPLLSHSEAADIRVGARDKFTPTQQSQRPITRPQQRPMQRPQQQERVPIKERLGRVFKAKKKPFSPKSQPIDNLQSETEEPMDVGDEVEAGAPAIDMNESQDTELGDPSDTKKQKRNKKVKGSATPGEEPKKSISELNTPKEKNPELESRTVYVGNVPKDMSKKQLHKIFSEFGRIQTVRFRCAAPDKPSRLKKVAINKKELHPDRNSLAAYIRYSTREEAEKAKAVGTGMEVMEHHLTVDLADNSHKKDNKRAIFVGNLVLKLHDDELWSFFEDCGKIESVRIIRDRDTGLGKGFGYVNFEDRASVESALRKEGSDLRRRPIRITRCVEKYKKDQQNYGGGGGGDSRRSGKKDKISQGQRQRGEKFSGDQTAEIGKVKRESKKPNQMEMKKARIAKQLQQGSSTNAASSAQSQRGKERVKPNKKNKPKHMNRKLKNESK